MVTGDTPVSMSGGGASRRMVRGRYMRKGGGPRGAGERPAHQQRRGGDGEANGGRAAEQLTARWSPAMVGNGDGGGDSRRPGPIPFAGLERVTRRF
jgi:hypothetical protein